MRVSACLFCKLKLTNLRKALLSHRGHFERCFGATSPCEGGGSECESIAEQSNGAAGAGGPGHLLALHI